MFLLPVGLWLEEAAGVVVVVVVVVVTISIVAVAVNTVALWAAASTLVDTRGCGWCTDLELSEGVFLVGTTELLFKILALRRLSFRTIPGIEFTFSMQCIFGFDRPTYTNIVGSIKKISSTI